MGRHARLLRRPCDDVDCLYLDAAVPSPAIGTPELKAYTVPDWDTLDQAGRARHPVQNSAVSCAG